MAFLEKINRLVNKLFMAMGGIAVLGVMLLATANVVLRLFGHPFSGSYEIIGFLGTAVIAFALGYTQRRKDHIVVDVVTNRYPAWLKRTIDIVRFPVEMVFFAVVGWQLFRLGCRIRDEGEVSETLKIIYHPFIFCVAAGFVCLTLNLLFDFCTVVFGPVKKPAAVPRAVTKRVEVLEEVGGISGEKI